MVVSAIEWTSSMLRLALALAALMIAATPAALGLLRNASFTPEAPVQAPERSSQIQPMRPDPEVDGKEDRESRPSEPGRAHNESDERTARPSRAAS